MLTGGPTRLWCECGRRPFGGLASVQAAEAAHWQRGRRAGFPCPAARRMAREAAHALRCALAFRPDRSSPRRHVLRWPGQAPGSASAPGREWLPPAAAPCRASETGRASRWECVCQISEITVLDVSLKTKNEQLI